MRKLILILCVGFMSLLWVLSSCTRLPPGNSFYALTIMTANKLNLIAEFGPADLDEYDSDSSIQYDTFFVPDKSSYATGFIVQRKDTTFRFWYRNSTGALSNYLQSGISTDLAKPQYLAETITGYTGALLFLKFSTSGTYLEILQYKTDTGGLVFNQASSSSLYNKFYADFHTGGIFTLSNINNVSIKNACYSPVNNRLYFLFVDTGNSRYYECNYSLDNTQLISPAATRSSFTYVSLTLPGSHWNYFYDAATGTGVANTLDFNESNACYWDNTLTPVAIPNQTYGIQYLLTGSLITSVADNEMMIYDYQGVLKNTVFLGGIKFLYEQPGATGSYQMFFSYCSTINNGNDREYYFSLYAFSTADFTGL